MSKETSTMHGLGIFVHAVLVAFHCLGVLYNFKRKNYVQAGIHTAVAGYDTWAVNHHLEALRRTDEALA